MGFNNGISAGVPPQTHPRGFNNGISAVVPPQTHPRGFNNGISAVIPPQTYPRGSNNGTSAVIPVRFHPWTMNQNERTSSFPIRLSKPGSFNVRSWKSCRLRSRRNTPSHFFAV
ncbi:hypothetical protein [Paenibacillus sp. P46E]|uniref:hypothetical protein n=1 Tax=Paenibacillus sp. P46E TaxID=1349436 RepID=UPI00093D39ED|nr:hypothetical protein [Paenibacillus sp. P46E]OKP95976.1 hypothetical protein A3849_23355 [Paenibacillus sp. P46E]